MISSGSSAIVLILVLCILPVPRVALRRPLVRGDKRFTVEGHQLGKQDVRATALGHGDTPV
jgi:hypothetical protein